MKFFKQSIRIQLCLLILCIASPVFAQDSTAQILDDLKPILDCQTVTLANMPLESLKFAGSAKQLISGIEGFPQDTRWKVLTQAKYFQKVADSLKKAGAHDINVISRLGTLVRQERLIAIRCADEAAATKVAQKLEKVHVGYYGSTVKGNLVLLGWNDALNRLPRIEESQLGILKQGLELAGDLPFRVVVTLSPDQKKALIAGDGELWDVDSPSSITNFQYATIGVDILKQKFAARIVCKDRESATAIAEKANASLNKFAGLNSVARNLPKLSKWLKGIELNANGNTISMDASNDDFATMVSSLGQPITQLLKVQKYSEETGRLRTIALGLLKYEEKHGTFPPAYSVDAKGKPLHSWRVLILPYIEQRNLYNEFRMDEPWDSEHNLKVAQLTPIHYVVNKRKLVDNVLHTQFLALVSDNSAIHRKGTKIQDIVDGTVSTMSIAIGAKEQAVMWTKPEDITATPKKIAEQMKASNPDGFWAATCDSAVHFVPPKADTTKLSWAIQINDGELLTANGDALSEALVGGEVPNPMYDPSELIPRWWTDYLIPVPWIEASASR